MERWLAAPRFSYVGETDYDQASKTKTGHLAFIDNETDTVPWRPEAGRGGGDVAVSPDGTRVYLTDVIKPELYVFDADSRDAPEHHHHPRRGGHGRGRVRGQRSRRARPCPTA